MPNHSEYENLQKLYEMTKDELMQLKALVKELLSCPSLTLAGPKAIDIIEKLKGLS